MTLTVPASIGCLLSSTMASQLVALSSSSQSKHSKWISIRRLWRVHRPFTFRRSHRRHHLQKFASQRTRSLIFTCQQSPDDSHRIGTCLNYTCGVLLSYAADRHQRTLREPSGTPYALQPYRWLSIPLRCRGKYRADRDVI